MSDMQKTLPPQRPVINVELINQRNNKDCVVACIAMVCGVSYDDVMNIVKQEEDALPLKVLSELCLLAHFQHLPLREVDGTLYTDRCYLLTVPSLNHEGLNHRIVVTTYDDNFLVYDPQDGNEGKKYYNSETLKSWGEVTEIIRCKDL